MKKTILLAACLFSLGTVVKAQEVVQPKKTELPTKVNEHKGVKGKSAEHKGEHAKLTVEQRAQKSVDQLNKRVTLTEDQKPKIYNLALDRATKVDAIKAKYKGTPENKETAKTEIETVRKEYREQVKGVLTAEQIASLKEKAKTMKGEGRGKGKGQQNGKGKGLDKAKGKEKVKEVETEASENDLIDDAD